MNDDDRKDLEDIKFLLKNQRDAIKPMFGLMFWQLSDLEGRLGPDEIAAEGMSLTLADDDDALYAEFFGIYIRLWTSAADLGAASRFIASALDMSADELLQCRQAYRKAVAEGSD